jgi:hypothetical protein
MFNDTPLLALDRWLSILRYGHGHVILMPSAAAVQAALRKLKKYGVKTYAYQLRPNGVREFRVRSAQAEWAHYLLAGNDPAAWSDRNPRAAARNVGFAGMVLDFFQRF